MGINIMCKGHADQLLTIIGLDSYFYFNHFATSRVCRGKLKISVWTVNKSPLSV